MPVTSHQTIAQPQFRPHEKPSGQLAPRSSDTAPIAIVGLVIPRIQRDLVFEKSLRQLLPISLLDNVSSRCVPKKVGNRTSGLPIPLEVPRLQPLNALHRDSHRALPVDNTRLMTEEYPRFSGEN